MSWNPFKTRQGSTDGASSTFQRTVIEDRARSQFDALHALLQEEEGGAPLGTVGRYELRTVLGEGGLGTVYGGWDPLLSRRVAVKMLKSQALPQTAQAGMPSPEELTLHEARAAARLSHPHIVTVFDAGSSPQGIYIAMEPLHGLDLRQMLRQGWRPSPQEAASLVRRVAEALAYAHGKGVIHCDVKPANIFMVDRRMPKVLDFGIARLARGDGSAILAASIGSPHYLAPEQLTQSSIDRRCDVYALGVVLFELLTGRVPYTGHSMEEISRAVLKAPQPVACQWAPQAPEGLSAIAARAMARHPDARFASARHLANALRDWKHAGEAEPPPPAPGQRGLFAWLRGDRGPA